MILMSFIRIQKMEDTSVKAKPCTVITLVLICTWTIAAAILLQPDDLRKELGKIIDSNLTISEVCK